jgi:hypothetical protein
MADELREVPDEESLAHEAEAVARVTGSLGAALAPVLARTLATYAAGRTGGALASLIRGWLGALSWPKMTPRLQEVAVESVDLGVDRASRYLSAPQRRKARRTRGPVLEVPDLDAATRSRLEAVADRTRDLKLDTKRDLDAVVGGISAVRSRAEGQVRWTVTQGLNAGTSAVARSLDRRLIWVTELDGCLHCLAYAGHAVEPGDTFPVGLTFGDRPLEVEGMEYPPLHPGCRCQVQLYTGAAGPPPSDRSAVDAAARLAAEARRSVVYGWTAHASQAATMRAMSRLLTSGAGLAPSVERRARELVRQGRTLDPPK